GGYLLG
nr:Chain A, prion peptide [synthetic construct]4UBZ_B Chain B, prion peptide [synthetic construct]